MGKMDDSQRPDYAGAAQSDFQQGTQVNRPNQTNAFGGQVQWTQGPDGQWNQNQSFSGPMAGAAGSLQQQLAQMFGQGLDLNSLGQMPDGSAARDQAIQAAYGQATSRLDPQWQQREQQLQTQLANQGLDPNSEAGRNAMRQFGEQRNDAYGSAMNSAIGQGTAAGSALFGQQMGSRQQMLAELLRQRGQPLQDMQGMAGLLGQQGFMGAQGPQGLGAQVAQGNWDMGQWDRNNAWWRDTLGAAGDVATSFL